MIKCQDCGVAQHKGALFCGECGASLFNPVQQSTGVLPFTQELGQPPPSLAGQSLEPSALPMTITFFIPSSGRRVTLSNVYEVEVGRKDEVMGITPGLDLTVDDGAQSGVSRLHARILLTTQGAVLSDLNSTNGTLLNNFRLRAEEPYLLQSGDEVRFGHLLAHVFIN